MFRKKNGSKKLFENMPVEPEHVEPPVPEAEQAGQEQEEALAANQAEDVVIPQTGASLGDHAKPEGDKESTDDILEDVRRSLIEEEEAHQKEAQPKWWQRIRKGGRKPAVEEEAPRPVEELNLPNLEAMEERIPEPEPEPDLDSIDDLIDLLESEEKTEKKPAAVEPAPVEEEKPIDIEELKKHAFQPRSTATTEDALSEVRTIALEGGEEVFVEIQTASADPLEERLSAVENALHPYRRLINFGLAFLGLVMAVIAAAVLYNMYQRSLAKPPAEEVVSNLPFPTSVRLPGGWGFNLGKGALEAGHWNPQGAEWLQGTEVCRWVALPWSRQLEAVLRTLNPDDPIELGMSNNDTLIYKVYSIEQMSPEEMQKLDSNRPCLLIVLAEPDAEQRWVLTALP